MINGGKLFKQSEPLLDLAARHLDLKKGREFSAVLGFTHNWENKDTDYQNGTDAHVAIR
jgi:hypothetical protein